MEAPTYHTSAMAAKGLTVGSVLSRTFSTLKKNPVVFFGLPLIFLAPTTVIDVLLPDSFDSGLSIEIVEMILSLAVQGATAYGVFQVLRGQTATLGESVSYGMAHLGPLILTALLTGLGILAGTLLFVIPGIILACLWSVAIPVCVIERMGAIDSIKRSAQLTRGYRWPIFVLVLMISLAILGVAIGVVLIVEILTDSVAITTLLTALALTVVQAFNNVMSATIYFDLRAIKENITVDNLTAVFD